MRFISASDGALSALIVALSMRMPAARASSASRCASTRADAVPLQIVDDRERDLGDVAVAHEPRDPDRLAVD